jgi:PBP1b-binding outer membrane lipoprotein LpoB
MQKKLFFLISLCIIVIFLSGCTQEEAIVDTQEERGGNRLLDFFSEENKNCESDSDCQMINYCCVSPYSCPGIDCGGECCGTEQSINK